jgi:hypothetical protein
VCEDTIVPYDVEFAPMHLISEWVQPGTTQKRLNVAIVLPSGLTPDDYSVRVENDGATLVLRCVMPRVLSDSLALHKKWIVKDTSFQAYHPLILEA